MQAIARASAGAAAAIVPPAARFTARAPEGAERVAGYDVTLPPVLLAASGGPVAAALGVTDHRVRRRGVHES